MNINDLRVEVEAMIEQLTPEIDWSRPEPYHPLFVAYSFQMAAMMELAKPENQIRMWQSMWGIK